MKILNFKPIMDSKERPWFRLFQLNVDRDVVANWTACTAHVALVDGLGKADYWAVEFGCGLQIAFEFLHQETGDAVYAVEPNTQHVGRHLRHWRDALREYPPELFERERTHMIERFAKQLPELMEAHAYQLWRQGDDGNPMMVGVPTSLRDSRCWQAELESHKHKQIYWISRAAETCT